MDVAKVEAIVAAPKNSVVITSTGLRPTLSASGPNTKAPIIRPNSPAPNSGASWAGASPQAARNAGAIKPTAAVSKPSIATTRKQNAITQRCDRDSGWALMNS